ncbi:unnamed protein product [marine sediment metagenome]|uniref:Uncharacterized protein n=1 Tax=marine sediment metagenome TaxID=412755 RepID=X1IUR3_9ZZZZ
MYDFIKSLVQMALGHDQVEDVTILFKDKHVDDVIRLHQGTRELSIVWIDGEIQDPLYQFWRLQKAQVFSSPAHVIFTGVGPNPAWRDLDVYEGCLFGTVYFLVYDDVTSPGVKPSQRGLYRE